MWIYNTMSCLFMTLLSSDQVNELFYYEVSTNWLPAVCCNNSDSESNLEIPLIVPIIAS